VASKTWLGVDGDKESLRVAANGRGARLGSDDLHGEARLPQNWRWHGTEHRKMARLKVMEMEAAMKKKPIGKEDGDGCSGVG
jgi:hypothetical protein